MDAMFSQGTQHDVEFVVVDQPPLQMLHPVTERLVLMTVASLFVLIQLLFGFININNIIVQPSSSKNSLKTKKKINIINNNNDN